MEGSPMSAGGQVSSPLLVYPAPSPARSPMSPHERAYSTDLALACTSQAQDNGSHVAPAATQIAPAEHINRCGFGNIHRP